MKWLKKLKKHLKLKINNKQFKDIYDQNKHKIIINLKQKK